MTRRAHWAGSRAFRRAGWRRASRSFPDRCRSRCASWPARGRVDADRWSWRGARIQGRELGMEAEAESLLGARIEPELGGVRRDAMVIERRGALIARAHARDPDGERDADPERQPPRRPRACL